MAKKPLNAEEIAELRSSPYVASIIGNKISFTPEFKRMAYGQMTNGKTMREVFELHGIDPEILGDARIWGFAEKLRAKAEREEGFADLRSQNSRKPAKEAREQTLAARVEQLEHELAYTRQEVEFLKKNTYGRFGGAEVMGIQAAPEVKFALIREATLRDNNLLKISKLCEIAGVSRSGYYNWCANEPARQRREDADRKDFELILEAYRFRGYAKGARGIHMRLLHYPRIIMNVKKIRRLMRKYGLFCPIRKPNPYRQMARDMQTSHVAENVVNREFKRGARKVLLTDITYLFYGKKGKCYLSTLLDAYTHEVLAYCVSESFKVDFVLETVDHLIAEHGCTLDNETIVHSDQGCHYTSYAFIQKLKDAEFVQSMSRRGNCWDNSPQESFFGHMKDEIADLIEACETYEQVVAQVDDWMDYYNNDRGQWDLLKLTPKEYYEYLQTGIYPLPVYEKGTSRGSAPDPEV